LPLPISRPLNEVYLSESTTSVATTPVAVTAVAPVAGYIERIAAAAAGTTTGTINVAVSVNGGADIMAGQLNIPAGTGARNGAVAELSLLGNSAVHVNEGDCITFTPSGGTGAAIGGAFVAVIRR
jgi:hypothetical protein